MKVDVVSYNRSWKQKYEEEAAKIRKACGDKILTIEHGGSTSIEGIAAKPVIDIFIGVRKLEDADAIIPIMKQLHYQYVTKFENVLPFRRFFTKDINDERAFHVHTVEASHTFRRDDLMFKDYITSNVSLKKEYEELKLDLAKREWSTSLEYNEAKTDFIIAVKARALQYFGNLYEETESEATYLIHSYSTDEQRRKSGFKLYHEDGITAIRCDIFPGFSLNRALGFRHLNERIINRAEEFFQGKKGKFALQIPPGALDNEIIKLLGSRGYTKSNSWVIFYRDSSPVETKGTDLEIREIGREHASEFGYILNEIFGFPHEFDDIASSAVGTKEWVIFMVFDKGMPVGSAGVCITGETAYLSYANVLPEYRRRGAQAELLARRIDAARKRGAKWMMVDTAETSDEHPNPSYWNMLRFGFRLLYLRPNYVKIQ